MSAQDRMLRALLRLEADKNSINATVHEVERVEDAVQDLGQTAEDLSLGQRIQAGLGRVQAGVGRGLGRAPGIDPLGKLTDTAKDRLEFLGDGFDQLITTLDELGVELDATAAAGLQAATSLARISTDPIGAMVNAVGQAVVAWQNFTAAQAEGQEQVDDAWGDFVDGSFGSAAELAQEYNDAQGRVNQALDEGGVIADLFVDQAKALNANQRDLNDALLDSATSYDDYVQSVQYLNDNLGAFERALSLSSQAEFEHRQELGRVMEAYRQGTATLRDVAEAMGGLEGFLLKVRAAAQEIMTFDEMSAALEERDDALNQALENYSQATDAAVAEWADKSAGVEQEAADERLAIEAQWGRNTLQLDLDLASERERLAVDLGDELARLESQAANERGDVMQDYFDQAREAEREHYQERAEAAAEFGQEVARAEQDHQVQMRRMSEDSGRRQVDAIRARDALALLDERRDYEQERQRAEQDYGLDMARQHEDYARQMAAMEAAFQAQEAARQADYAQQIATLDQQLAREQDVVRQANDERLTALDETRQREIVSLHGAKEEKLAAVDQGEQEQLDALTEGLNKQVSAAENAYNRETAQAEQQFEARRQQIGWYLDGELEQVRAHYDQRAALLQQWLAESNAIFQANAPGRAGGGYVGSGLYQVGEQGREFVLSNLTTQAAERLAGGSLNQAGVLAAMGGARIDFTQNLTIGDARDPARVAALVRRETYLALDNLLQRAR